MLDCLLYFEVGLRADVVLAQPLLLCIEARVTLHYLSDSWSSALRESHACVHDFVDFHEACQQLLGRLHLELLNNSGRFWFLGSYFFISK